MPKITCPHCKEKFYQSGMDPAMEMVADDWAEMVVNQLCNPKDVPKKFEEEVKALLVKLLDPNAPIPPTTFHNKEYQP